MGSVDRVDRISLTAQHSVFARHYAFNKNRYTAAERKKEVFWSILLKSGRPGR